MRTVVKEPAAAKVKVIRKVVLLRGMSSSQNATKVGCNRQIANGVLLILQVAHYTSHVESKYDACQRRRKNFRDKL